MRASNLYRYKMMDRNNFRGCLTFCLSLFASFSLSFATDVEVEYCHYEKFRAHCGRYEVVQVTSAHYGRMKYGRCTVGNYGYIGCNADVKHIVESRCSGRQSCTISVAADTEEMSRVSKCPYDLMKYLSVSYTCAKAQGPTDLGCTIRLTNENSLTHIGVLSSAYTEECGMSENPWIFKLPNGYSINFTLIDYTKVAVDGQDKLDMRPFTSVSCQVYAYIKEDGETTHICGDLPEQSSVYVSKTNTVEVRLLPGNDKNKRNFLLEYKLNGCPLPEAPKDGYMRVNGNTIIMGCLTTAGKESDKEWSLTCIQNSWHGNAESNTCETEAVLGRSVQDTSYNISPYFSITLILCVAFILGCVILTTGVCVLKRKRSLHTNSLAMHYETTANERMLYKATPHIPDYLGNPPPYYAGNKVIASPDHDYEYVADLIGHSPNPRLENTYRPELPKERKKSAQGTAYGTLETDILSTSGSTGNVVLPLNPVSHVNAHGAASSGNEYVSDGNKVSTQLPKYFELNPKLRLSQNHRIAESMQSYPPLNNTKHNLGHYSQ